MCLPVKIRALGRPIPHRRRPRADHCRCIAIASISAASPQSRAMKVYILLVLVLALHYCVARISRRYNQQILLSHHGAGQPGRRPRANPRCFWCTIWCVSVFAEACSLHVWLHRSRVRCAHSLPRVWPFKVLVSRSSGFNLHTCLAGVFTAAFVCPLDVLKTRIQVQPVDNPKYRGILRASQPRQRQTAAESLLISS